MVSLDGFGTFLGIPQPSVVTRACNIVLSCGSDKSDYLQCTLKMDNESMRNAQPNLLARQDGNERQEHRWRGA